MNTAMLRVDPLPSSLRGGGEESGLTAARNPCTIGRVDYAAGVAMMGHQTTIITTTTTTPGRMGGRSA